MEAQQSATGTRKEGQRQSALMLGDDPLYKELQKWKKDIDGVLGSIGDGSELRFNPNPSSSTSTSAAKDSLPASGIPTNTIGKLRKLPPLSPFIKSKRTLSAPSPPQSPNLPAFAPHSFGPSFNETNKAFGELRSGKTSSSTLPIGKREVWEGDEPGGLERRGSLPTTRTKDSVGEDIVSTLPLALNVQDSTLPLAPPISSTPEVILLSEREAPEEAQGLETITEFNSNSTLSTSASSPSPGKNGDTSTPETEGEGGEENDIPPVLITRSPSPGPGPAASASAIALSLPPVAPIPIPPAANDVSLGSIEGEKEEVELEENARECAKKCWEEDEAFLKREKIAEWLGMT